MTAGMPRAEQLIPFRSGGLTAYQVSDCGETYIRERDEILRCASVNEGMISRCQESSSHFVNDFKGRPVWAASWWPFIDL